MPITRARRRRADRNGNPVLLVGRGQRKAETLDLASGFESSAPAISGPGWARVFDRRPRPEVRAWDPCRIFAGNASRKLADPICEALKVPSGTSTCRASKTARFRQVQRNIRGSDVFIIQATGRRRTT